MSLEAKLQDWIVRETSGICEGHIKTIPNITTLSLLTSSKNAKIWKYVTEHVKSRQSVEHIRNILRLKRAQNDLHCMYAPKDRNDTIVLQQEIVKAKEKVNFIENSNKNITNYISSLKNEIQVLKKEACLLSQKCTLFEIVWLQYQEKNAAMEIILVNLSSLLNAAFSNKETRYFKSLKAEDFSEIYKSSNSNFCSITKIKNINDQLLSVVEQIPHNQNYKISSNLIKSVVSIMDNTTLIQLTNVLKEFSKQSCLLKKIDLDKPMKVSQKLFQDLNLNFYNSSCNLELKVFENKLSEKIISSEKLDVSDNGMQKQFYLLSVQNEGMKLGIKYLEGVLSSELHETKCLIEKNNEQNSSIELKFTEQEFYRKLESLNFLLSTTQQIFSSIQDTMISSNEFAHSELFFSESDKYGDFFNIENTMRNNFKMSLDLITDIKTLWTPFADSMFKNFQLDWKTLRMESFQNLHLICQKINWIKKELLDDELFSYDSDDKVTENMVNLISNFQDKTEHLENIRKHLVTKTKENCKHLNSILKEWWEQNAQFIPAINYGGKSLKMWLSILCVLEDTL